MPAFQDPVQADLKAMNNLMGQYLHSPVAMASKMAEHLLLAGGKRLRALCAMLAARACGYDGTHHITLAAALEFIHAATLLHDDVVDASEHRRGRPTVNSIWGNNNSVLGGDFLYSRAFQMLVELECPAVIRLLADATNQIAEGEIQQAQYRLDEMPSEQQYLQVIHKKTATLFSAAAASGALLASSTEDLVRNLGEFGAALGAAYQIQDDLLDLEGAAAEMGKDPGDDIAAGRPNLPLIHALAEDDSGELQEALTAAQPDLQRVHQLVQDAGGMGYARAQMQVQLERARASLEPLDEGPCKDALRNLADSTAGRKS